MGNIVMVKSKKAKVMKIDGDSFRLRTPARASDATKEYPGFVLLDSEAVKRFGVRAKPLEPNEILIPNKTYFLVELPKLIQPHERNKRNKLPYRRVMSDIHIGAKERLEMLMLSRRTVSDVAIAKSDDGDGLEHGQKRVKLRLPRSQIIKLMKENNDASELTTRVMDGYLGGGDNGGLRRKLEVEEMMKSHYKAREKHVSFAEIGGRGEIAVL